MWVSVCGCCVNVISAYLHASALRAMPNGTLWFMSILGKRAQNVQIARHKMRIVDEILMSDAVPARINIIKLIAADFLSISRFNASVIPIII